MVESRSRGTTALKIVVLGEGKDWTAKIWFQPQNLALMDLVQSQICYSGYLKAFEASMREKRE